MRVEALAFCLLPFALTSAQVVVRDRVPAPAASTAVGAGSIAGTVVTDEATPQPVARARVELTAEGQPPRTAFTDSAGAFAFADLPAGRYSLSATRPAWVRANYGAKRPNRPGTPITIADGQRIAGLQLRLMRGAVITGTIRDEFGQPAPGAIVRVMQYRTQNGERTLVPVPLPATAVGEPSDDRGVYRLYGLPPGEYIVAATPRPLGPGDIRLTTDADLQAARRAAQQREGAAPSPPPDASATVTYATVFFPGTTSAAAATPVAVAAGEERSGVDLTLQLVRTSRIEGTVSSPAGVAPESVRLLIVPAGPAVSGLPGAMMFNNTRPDSDGRFTFRGIAPGGYTLTARAAGGLWATADVAVDGETVSGVRLDLAPGLTIAGRIVVDAPAALVPDLSAARIMLKPSGGGMVVMSLGGSASDGSDPVVHVDGRFTIPNVVPGRYRLTAQIGGPGGWTLKSATAGGRDIFDFPLEIGPNDRIGDAVLTFSNRTQEVSGTLQDASGRPAPDYTVIVFPAENRLWDSPLRIATARPSTDGRFQLRNLPAGDYRIAALVDIAPGEANDPALLEQLVPASVVFTLREGERKVQDIRIAGGS